MITPIQPKVPEAKVRGSQEGVQCVLVSPERVPGVRKGVPRGPVGPPGPPELAALLPPRQVASAAKYAERGVFGHGHLSPRR